MNFGASGNDIERRDSGPSPSADSSPGEDSFPKGVSQVQNSLRTSF